MCLKEPLTTKSSSWCARHRTTSSDRRRGEGGSLAPQNQLLWAGGAHQPGKAVHLGEGKPLFQTSAALRPYPFMIKASGVNLKVSWRQTVASLVLSVLWRGGKCYITPLRLASDHTTLHYTWRGHSSFTLGIATTQRMADTGYKLPLNCRRAQCQGSSRRWERFSNLTGQLLPASSWAAPSQ